MKMATYQRVPRIFFSLLGGLLSYTNDCADLCKMMACKCQFKNSNLHCKCMRELGRNWDCRLEQYGELYDVDLAGIYCISRQLNTCFECEYMYYNRANELCKLASYMSTPRKCVVWHLWQATDRGDMTNVNACYHKWGLTHQPLSCCIRASRL